jgi:putative inorganic carbon (hco3(-)) transporter
MNSVWQQFTLSNLPLYQWRSASYLYRLVGLLQGWRQGSWLMPYADAIGALLICLVFALAPFVSNALVGVLLASCVGFWIILTLSENPGNKITLYWGIAIAATAMSPVKRDALAGLIKLTLYLGLFVLMASLLRRSRIRSLLIGVYLLTALIVSVYGLQQSYFGAAALATWVDPESPLAKTTRVYSYLGNPNLLAGYLVPAITLSLAAVFVWRGKAVLNEPSWRLKILILAPVFVANVLGISLTFRTKGSLFPLELAILIGSLVVLLLYGLLPQGLALTMFGVNSACLILTYSRGGWIGFVVAMFAFLMLLVFWYSIQFPAFWRTWSLPILLGSLITTVLLAVLFVPPVRDRVLSMFVGREDSSNNFRINVWAAVVEMIRDRPILGIGPGNNAFNKIYPLYMRPRFSALSAYSVILEVAVETGFIGLGCFLWLLLVTLNQGWVQLNRLRQLGSREAFWLMGAIATLLGMLSHGTFDTVLYRPEVNTLWWLMIAIIASYYKPKDAAIARQPQ